jgi:hypothetical protein
MFICICKRHTTCPWGAAWCVTSAHGRVNLVYFRASEQQPGVAHTLGIGRTLSLQRHARVGC